MDESDEGSNEVLTEMTAFSSMLLRSVLFYLSNYMSHFLHCEAYNAQRALLVFRGLSLFSAHAIQAIHIFDLRLKLNYFSHLKIKDSNRFI